MLVDAAAPPLTDPDLARAWRLLRTIDCARCHGKDFEGLAAPSIVKYATSQSKEMFVRAILEGDTQRGMPGYRDNPQISGNIDKIYRYFSGRADGSIAAGSRPLYP
jgi:mono/diheme cytochrome c family protein